MNKITKHVMSVLNMERRIRGIERFEHFKHGGTLSAWRGIHTVIPDRKKSSSKKACRGQKDDQ